MKHPPRLSTLPRCRLCAKRREGSQEPWFRLMRQEDWRVATVAHFCESCCAELLKAADAVLSPERPVEPMSRKRGTVPKTAEGVKAELMRRGALHLHQHGANTVTAHWRWQISRTNMCDTERCCLVELR